MGIQEIFPQKVTIAGIQISDTVIYTWVLIGVLSILALLAHGNYREWQPRRWQLLIEYIIEYVENLIADTVGRSLPDTVPYLTTLIGFIAIANLMGVFPLLQAPTRDLNTTLALSLISLISTYYFGAKQRGIKAQMMNLFQPLVFLFPLNLVGEVSRVLSMALRLFGNVIATEIVGFTVFMLLPPLAPLPMYMLGMITGVLQALVFTVLTIVFVADALKLET